MQPRSLSKSTFAGACDRSDQRLQIAFGLVTRVAVIVCVLFADGTRSKAQSNASSSPLINAQVLDPVTRSLLNTHCGSCHGGAASAGDINFDEHSSIEKARREIEVWLKVRQVLNSRQMPPPDAPQPTDADLKRLRSWTNAFLKAEAVAKAGDPGPVLLRRLSNAEYDYAIRDLTGLTELDPTRDLPVDGAAGEGFTNVGSGQAMSPSLVRKYLDSAKRTAEHLVLLPTGIAFSASTTQRDHTNEKLAAIQDFYRRYTADGGGSSVNLQGIKFETNQGGLLPVDSYLKALIESRSALDGGDITIAKVASENGLNQRYLSSLWDALANKESGSFLIRKLRTFFKTTKSADADLLVNKIKQAQNGFWKFNSIGHIGREGGPARWMDPVIPVVEQQELRLPLANSDGGNDVQVSLTTHDLGDGDAQDFVVWSEPRLLMKANANGSPSSIMLRDVSRLSVAVRAIQHKEIGRTTRYLDAMMSQLQGSADAMSSAESRSVSGNDLDHELLGNWNALLGLENNDTRKIAGLFSNYLSKVQGYDSINGWGSEATPSVLANRSEESISYLTLDIPPRSVVVHPSPSSAAVVAWKSPVAGHVKITSTVADADSKCGNGAAWKIEHRTRVGTTLVAQGSIENGGRGGWNSLRPLSLAIGDVVALMILPRDSNHACDTTHVELEMVEVHGEQRTWTLGEQVVDRMHEGNPMADLFGNADVWNFGKSVPPSVIRIPELSALSLWRKQAFVLAGTQLADRPVAGSRKELSRLAKEVQRVLTADDLGTLSAEDRELRKRMLDWRGPLRWLDLAILAAKRGDSESLGKKNPLRFGFHPDGSTLKPNDLCRRGTSTIQFSIPGELAATELVTTTKLHQSSGGEGSVQTQIHIGSVDNPALDFGGTFLVHPKGAIGASVRSAVQSFGALFPPALCYSRIVPVDEVVTLRLFYREDEHLSRLMLDSVAVGELDQLWDELLFVSEEPSKLAVAFEQLAEFATQDRPDLVTAFEPLKVPINRRAEEFRKHQIAVESVQLNAVVSLAERAWRHRIKKGVRQRLIDFYQHLREDEMQHKVALQALIARVLTAPEFLYKLESPQPGTGQSDVGGEALASRLSFFLWSSLPDSQLLELGRTGQLNDNRVMIQQMQRMLSDPRSKRLAEQFACQWLHFRNFDSNDDKNETLYPEFAALRKSMYGETLRFFEDMFQNNGSILDLIDADHTFVDQALAGHYGFRWDPGKNVDPDISDDRAWQRIDGIRLKGRGGVLGMATFFASQSGASRTSPILRGNWIYETLLGEHLPRPPADVPLLPEEVPDGLTSRQLIEQHSSVEACAKCHAHIDPFGFALEDYDALGQLREADVDTKAKLLDGRVLDGAQGLRNYLIEIRRDDLVRQFCRKLVGFALGREVLLSDEPLLDQMQQALKAADYRFEIAVEKIIESPQFRQIRDQQSTIQP
ncbi:DUF1592 domain-containing protein [bacterium]|nr:DUF1592 domain-containing protein [bacterium]